MPDVHPRLEAFTGKKGAKAFSKLLSRLEADLFEIGCADFDVTLRYTPDRGSLIDRYLEFQKGDEADRWMLVESRIEDRNVRISVPMLKTDTLPYGIDITLRAAIEGMAWWEQGFIKKRWRAKPRDKAIEKTLDQARVPDVVWKHGFEGHQLRTPHLLVSDGDGNARWLIESGYFGFATTGPVVSPFVGAASRIEAALAADPGRG